MRPFLSCYTFPPKYYFSSILQISALAFLFLFISRHFLILLWISSLTHGLFRSNQISGDFFPDTFLLISTVMLLWTESIFCIQWILLHFCVLWPRIWSILWITPWTLQKNLCFVVWGQCVLWLSIRSIGLIELFRPFMFYWVSVYLIYLLLRVVWKTFVCSLCRSLLFNALSCQLYSLWSQILSSSQGVPSPCLDTLKAVS